MSGDKLKPELQDAQSSKFSEGQISGLMGVPFWQEQLKRMIWQEFVFWFSSKPELQDWQKFRFSEGQFSELMGIPFSQLQL